MNPYQKFHSFAPSEEVSPKTFKQSTFQSLNTHQFSIHIPPELLESTIPLSQSQNNIQVYCRLRPSVKIPDVIKYDSTMIDDGQNHYSFDRIFGKLTSQEEIFQGVAKRHIEDFLMGYNSTIFAYGQTGSGKTHTMFGQMRDKKSHGIIPRTLEQIFKRDLNSSTITCSMLEIYNQRIMDLLNPMQNMEIKMKEFTEGIFLQGLIEVSVDNEEQLMNLIKLGHKSRKIATTSTNDVSSRSHTVLFLYRNFKCQNEDVRCKLCFIDLAGSQKIRKSGAQGQTLEEAKKINLSLSCLGNVIHALTNGSDHIPYRNSKLTRILKDSLGGDTKTSIITTCSLEKCDHLQTISTIKFAVRAKKIKNKLKLKSMDCSLEEKVQNLMKQISTFKQKYEEAQIELAFYKNKQKLETNIHIDDIPQEQANYQPLRSICLSGGMSSRTNLGYNSFHNQ